VSGFAVGRDFWRGQFFSRVATLEWLQVGRSAGVLQRSLVAGRVGCLLPTGGNREVPPRRRFARFPTLIQWGEEEKERGE